jgi:hypothetical protein
MATASRGEYEHPGYTIAKKIGLKRIAQHGKIESI